jgi:undecaprenyl-diphosphatase
VRYGVMDLVARARPPQHDWRAAASGWSFPSGHTTTSAVTAGLLILAVCLRSPRGRTALCTLFAVWAAAVGLTRIYLGVHWLTDVIGGWLFAIGWLALCTVAASRRLPAHCIPGAAEPTPPHPIDPADGPRESHAPEDPPGRGRSRPA